MWKRDYIANSLNTVGFLEVKTKCQEHNISGLLSWVLFYSASLLFKQRRKSWKCNINFYMAFIFIHGAVWNSGVFLLVWGEGGSVDCAAASFLAENRRCWLFSRVWGHGMFCGKRCGGVGADLRRHVTSLRMTSATFFWRGQSCKTFSYYALINENLQRGEHTQTLLKDELGESEESRFIKSLFWNF